MHRIAWFILACSPPLTLVASDELAHLLRLGHVGFEAVATGGHGAGALEVTVENRRPVACTVTVPAGWRFGSQDPTLQDLLVVDDAAIALGPNERGTLLCTAFCCEAPKRVPVQGARYTPGAMASAPLVELARHPLQGGYPSHARQQAIWSVSDDVTLAGIDCEDDAATKRLREFVSKLTGRPVPWYTTAFAGSDGVMAFNPEPVRVTGRVEFERQRPARVSIVLENAEGRVVRTLMNERPVGVGRNSIQVELEVLGWPKGLYRIVFLADGRTLKKDEFEL